MIKISSIANRMTICIVIIAILFLYVIVRAHHVQISRHDELLKKAKSKSLLVSLRNSVLRERLFLSRAGRNMTIIRKKTKFYRSSP